MDYEKKYKEALEKARQLCVYPTSKPFISDLQDLFPELIESEDERIRKELINYLITDEDNGVPKVGQIPIDNVITWLEKQKTIDVLDAEEREFADNVNSYRKDMDEFYKKGYDAGREAEKQYWLEKQDEQKSTDKVVPKFKVGDWVVSPNGVYWHIDRIENNRYEVTSDTGKCADWPLDTDLYHLWTIQDAKKGDVLACGKCILIFDQLSEFNNEQVLMDICHCTSKGFYWQDTKDRDLWVLDGFKPANKEQRDTLFAKMHEAGYEWDAEKRELKKISQRMISAEAKEAIYGKPTAWSEEEEEMLEDVRDNFEYNKGEMTDSLIAQYDKFFDKVKFLKPQPKQEWSEEDNYNLQCMIAKVTSDIQKGNVGRNNELIDWLNSLKQRINND